MPALEDLSGSNVYFIDLPGATTPIQNQYFAIVMFDF
ncbi:hypothetical protein B6N60_03552 [Richelia sinica FACHB-800]|uniref:Uncharacterized protein n=1 Tax=Richelia sinica FACHB-800 TaxID=1357546 RepID=A0A975TB81_9NOST|nr:hypothetical protein B6N60_00691 [Richelia sinica FACHB-800]QXE24842.1 hypothetical protein B6N60_03552 [Richelia sinica FACHB-800]